MRNLQLCGTLLILCASTAYAQHDVGGMGPGGSFSAGEIATVGGGVSSLSGPFGSDLAVAAMANSRAGNVDPAVRVACYGKTYMSVHQLRACDKAKAALQRRQ